MAKSAAAAAARKAISAVKLGSGWWAVGDADQPEGALTGQLDNFTRFC